MTFSFTAMGLIIAYVWLSVAFCIIIAAGKLAEGRWGWAIFNLVEALILGFLLVVR